MARPFLLQICIEQVILINEATSPCPSQENFCYLQSKRLYRVRWQVHNCNLFKMDHRVQHFRIQTRVLNIYEYQCGE